MDRHRTCDPLFHASEAVHRPGRQELRRIAVVFGEDSLTYGELDARANSSGTCCKGGNLDDSDRLRLPELAADLVRHQVSDRSGPLPSDIRSPHSCPCRNARTRLASRLRDPPARNPITGSRRGPCFGRSCSCLDDSVSVSGPRFRSAQADLRSRSTFARRRHDSSLLLATKARVNVDPPAA
jgi:hypothetical protein